MDYSAGAGEFNQYLFFDNKRLLYKLQENQ